MSWESCHFTRQLSNYSSMSQSSVLCLNLAASLLQECYSPFVNGSFFEHEGKPLCEAHYHQSRGSMCQACQQPILGRCVTAMGAKFHPHHLVCHFCLKPLSKGCFKEQENKPYCHPCFIKLFGWGHSGTGRSCMTLSSQFVCLFFYSGNEGGAGLFLTFKNIRVVRGKGKKRGSSNPIHFCLFHKNSPVTRITCWHLTFLQYTDQFDFLHNNSNHIDIPTICQVYITGIRARDTFSTFARNHWTFWCRDIFQPCLWWQKEGFKAKMWSFQTLSNVTRGNVKFQHTCGLQEGTLPTFFVAAGLNKIVDCIQTGSVKYNW